MDSAKIQIDLRQMILALETTVDLVGMNDTNHGKRVGYIASQIAHTLKFDKKDIPFIFELGLLHDCGVSTEQMHIALVNHFDWEESYIHCHIGYKLLKDFEPLQKFAIPILYHHTKWQELEKSDLEPKEAFIANLIFLSDRVDIMAAAHYGKDILLIRDEITKTIKSYSGTYFNPLIVDAFLEIEKSEAFWISLEDRNVTRYTWDIGHFESKRMITMDQLKYLSFIFAYIVDQKSPFTAQHSTRVGTLAKYLASMCGLDEFVCNKIEIAGFLHDIGKLRTPDEILRKKGPLSLTERIIINQHSYETYEILRHINGIEDIAIWSAYHHEQPNGTGYPFHPTKKEFSIEARIIAVADIFQALVQDRPYRKGMQLKEVIEILDEFVENGKVDKKVVNITKKYADKCYEIAQGLAKENKESEIIFSL